MAFPVIAIGPILKAIGGFFRAIPLWAWLAFAVLAAAFVYGEHKESQGMTRGLAKGLAERDKVQKAWDKAVERGKAAIAAKDAANAIEQAKAFERGQAIGERRVRDQQDIIADRDRLIADQRAGIVRLRQQWRGCVSQAEGGSSAGGAGGPQPADELRATGAADLVRIAADADSKVKRLQEFVQVQQELCVRIQ